MAMIKENWQKALFAVFGFYPLCLCAAFLTHGEMQQASIAFAIAFMSFLYSNLTRFKRFKGLGFEAELWEGKQIEAEILIDRLGKLVSVYTHEVVLGNVKRGRWDNASRWVDTWKLYDDLTSQQKTINQNNDFAKLKKETDDYFLFDMYSYCAQECYEILSKGLNSARDILDSRFPNPIVDSEGHSELYAILVLISSPPAVSTTKITDFSNLAKEYMCYCEYAMVILKSKFDVTVEFEASSWAKLNNIAFLYENRPVKVTPKLLSWASKHEITL